MAVPARTKMNKADVIAEMRAAALFLFFIFAPLFPCLLGVEFAGRPSERKTTIDFDIPNRLDKLKCSERGNYIREGENKTNFNVLLDRGFQLRTPRGAYRFHCSRRAFRVAYAHGGADLRHV